MRKYIMSLIFTRLGKVFSLGLLEETRNSDYYSIYFAVKQKWSYAINCNMAH